MNNWWRSPPFSVNTGCTMRGAGITQLGTYLTCQSIHLIMTIKNICGLWVGVHVQDNSIFYNEGMGMTLGTLVLYVHLYFLS